jgi:HEAT repeats
MRTAFKIAGLVGLALALGSAVWFLRHRPGASSPMSPSVKSAPNIGLTSPGRVSMTKHNAEIGNAHPSPAGETGLIPVNVALTFSVPGRISHIVNGDGGADFAKRVKAVHAIDTDLTAEETNAFYRYLQTPAKNSPDAEGENWLRNEMLDKLVQQTVVTNDLSQLLVALYRDTAQDDVLRDYALQHMAPVYGRVDTNEQASLQAALWQAVGETDTSIGGTALLALLNVAQTDPAVDQKQLAKMASQLAGDDSCGELTRITAVQICGRLRVDQALPVVQQLAQAAPSEPLQIAAMAALGDFGTPAAVNILERLAASPDPRLAQAAQSGLRRLARAQPAPAMPAGP